MLQVESFIGTTLVDGVLTTVITNRSGTETQLVYHELLAWYMPITLHDMKILLNQHITEMDGKAELYFLGIVQKLLYAPAQDRKRPTELEMVVRVPAKSEVTINIHFDKCLLRITEYPFDPDRGFDIR
jgi:phosphatidylinositol glycan class T